MNKTIAYLMFALVITSNLFSSCKKELTEENTGTAENLEINSVGGDAPEELIERPEPESQENNDSNVELKIDENKPTTQESESQTQTQDTPAPIPTQETSDPQTETTSSVYKDGTYTQTGSYVSPAGNETVSVTFVIDNDVVSSVTVTPQAKNETSKFYQGEFAKGVSAVVVGKKIDEVSVGKVNGSSLTPNGFNAALAAMKGGAKN